MNFKKSLFVSLILFSTIPIIILGTVSIYLTTKGVMESRMSYLETLAHTNGDSLSQLIAGQSREIEIMSAMAPIVEYLDSINSDKMPEEQKKLLLNKSKDFLEKWVTANPRYDSAILVNGKGEIISGCDLNSIGQNVSDKTYFKKGLQNKGTYFSDVTESIFTPNKKVFAMSHVVNTGDEKGVLILFASIEFFDDFVKNIQVGNTGLAAIFDSTGEAISHPDESFTYSKSSRALASVFANTLEEYFRGERLATGTIFYEAEGDERVCGYSVLEEENLNWLFIVRQNRNELLSPANVIYSAIAVVLLVSLIIAVISGFMLSNVFTKPLLTLKASFSRAAREELYLTCSLDNKNEFGELAESYNIMISRLNENHEELAASYERIISQEEELRQNYDQLQLEKKQKEYLAYHDSVTGLLNRQGFEASLEAVLDGRKSGGVFFIDLDNFKYINDVFGHNYGDKTLSQFGERLLNPELGLEFCSRAGGDEFLLVKLGDGAEIEATAKKLMNVFKKPIEVDCMTTYTTGSLGVAIFEKGEPSADILVKNADIAMYRAKEGGKNNYEFFNDEMRNSIERRNKIIDFLNNAVEEQEVYMVYQPEVDINSGKILAFESLMRVNNKELGSINPAEFIPIAEASKIILKLGYWSIGVVCDFAKSLVDKGIDFGVISINISPVQLMNIDFVPKFLGIVKSSGLDPKYLQIEVTESVLVNSIEATTEKLKEIRATGVSIALDDFGTGYSSLNYLVNLPVDVLKIDKSFMAEIYADVKKQIICKTIIDMSHKLGLKVVAEGVEKEEEITFLKEQGCDIGQGYFYSRPVEKEAAVQLIEKFSQQQ